MTSRRESRAGSQQLPLRSSEQLKAPFRSSEQGTEVLSASERLAAELIDDAFKRCRLENKEAAHLCGVSVSLVEKWRSSEARGCPSFVQMLCLPPTFHIALHKAMNARFGYARAALLELLEAAGALAVLTK